MIQQTNEIKEMKEIKKTSIERCVKMSDEGQISCQHRAATGIRKRAQIGVKSCEKKRFSSILFASPPYFNSEEHQQQ